MPDDLCFCKLNANNSSKEVHYPDEQTLHRDKKLSSSAKVITLADQWWDYDLWMGQKYFQQNV